MARLTIRSSRSSPSPPPPSTTRRTTTTRGGTPFPRGAPAPSSPSSPSTSLPRSRSGSPTRTPQPSGTALSSATANASASTSAIVPPQTPLPVSSTITLPCPDCGDDRTPPRCTRRDCSHVALGSPLASSFFLAPSSSGSSGVASGPGSSAGASGSSSSAFASGSSSSAFASTSTSTSGRKNSTSRTFTVPDIDDDDSDSDSDLEGEREIAPTEQAVSDRLSTIPEGDEEEGSPERNSTPIPTSTSTPTPTPIPTPIPIPFPLPTHIPTHRTHPHPPHQPSFKKEKIWSKLSRTCADFITSIPTPTLLDTFSTFVRGPGGPSRVGLAVVLVVISSTTKI
ncbi:hypothetical protein BDN72DRAFT_434692 [Pluteus cervinus]|uniref:Uncharacterized protein n=1 Tax=Pluteus cervinus TaxID=181527 RepID=A0ACD3A803_9AGAR|nr:hypothetical protein BDN72DRAFT_434692 [Pluteus cervinus]